MPRIDDLTKDADFLDLSEEEQVAVIEEFASIHGTESFKPIKETLDEPVQPEIRAPKEQTFMESFAEELPALAGGTAIGAAALAGGVGLVPTAGLVGIGAAGGEAFKQVAKQVFDSPDAPRSGEEAALKLLKTGTLEGLTELGFGYVGKIGSKILKKVAKPFDVKESAKKITRKFGSILTPAESTDSKILGVIENVIESSIFSGDLAKFNANRTKVFDDISNDLIDEVGARLSPNEFGEFFKNILDDNIEIHHDVAQSLYTKLGGDLPELNIPTSTMRTYAKDRLKVLKPLKGIGGVNVGEDILRSVDQFGHTFNYEVATELRSNLLARKREINLTSKNAKGIATIDTLIEKIDLAIENAILRQSPDNLGKWRAANNFYKRGKERFQNKFIRKVAQRIDDPAFGTEKAMKLFFKPGNSDAILQLKNILNRDEFGKFQSAAIKEMFDNSTDTATGAIIGNKLLRNLSEKGYGEKVLKQTFSKSQLENLRLFGEALQISAEEQAGGTGKMLIQMRQAGAVVQVAGAVGSAAAGYTSGSPTLMGTGMAILLAPSVLSKILLSKTGTKWLTEGLRTPSINAEKSLGLMARIVSAAIRAERGVEE